MCGHYGAERSQLSSSSGPPLLLFQDFYLLATAEEEVT